MVPSVVRLCFDGIEGQECFRHDDVFLGCILLRQDLIRSDVTLEVQLPAESIYHLICDQGGVLQ